jgi:hypothetical protein
VYDLNQQLEYEKTLGIEDLSFMTRVTGKTRNRMNQASPTVIIQQAALTSDSKTAISNRISRKWLFIASENV